MDNMTPDVSVPVFNMDLVSKKKTPLAAAEIAMTFPYGTKRDGEGNTTFTVSDKGAKEILENVPGAKIIDDNS